VGNSTGTIKLSAPETRQFWEIEVLHEDDALLALNKPASLLVSPDRYDPNRPNLMKLLHRDIDRGAPWVRERNISYLANAHRLDFETSGVILLAKTKPALVRLADLFGTEIPRKIYAALVTGNPEDEFEVNVKIGPHPTKTGLMRVDHKGGKKSRTLFRVRERFGKYALLECEPKTGRTHQIRIHLRHAGSPILGDHTYRGPDLLLSRLKPDYRLKPGKVERPLISTVALHAESLEIPHPTSGTLVKMEAPWPKDFSVAVKYLRRWAGSGAAAAATDSNPVEAGDGEEEE
jgi:RluA family pseudouridine synthase